MIYLKEVIRIDWAEINFIIGTNPEEFIEVKFERSPDADVGLKSYMNTLIHSNETISQFNLKKVLQYWGFKDEKYIYFMLMPPWIKHRTADIYQNLLLRDSMGDAKDDATSESASSVGGLGQIRKKDDPKLYSLKIDI